MDEIREAFGRLPEEHRRAAAAKILAEELHHPLRTVSAALKLLGLPGKKPSTWMTAELVTPLAPPELLGLWHLPICASCMSLMPVASGLETLATKAQVRKVLGASSSTQPGEVMREGDAEI